MNANTQYTIQMARCFSDRLEAFKLLQISYEKAGLSDSNAIRATKHQLLPQSRVFVTKSGNEVVATLSLIPDGPEGLPMEPTYSDEINRLRDRGLFVAEVGCFADRRQDPLRFIENFCHLTQFMAQYAFLAKIDGFVIAVHPRHARFYKNFVCFEEVGGLVNYPSVKNRPAVALFLEFERARVTAPEKYAKYFGDRIAPENFTDGAIPEIEVEYFQAIQSRRLDCNAPFPTFPFSPSVTTTNLNPI
jgi:hypothetical protein